MRLILGIIGLGIGNGIVSLLRTMRLLADSNLRLRFSFSESGVSSFIALGKSIVHFFLNDLIEVFVDFVIHRRGIQIGHEEYSRDHKDHGQELADELACGSTHEFLG